MTRFGARLLLLFAGALWLAGCGANNSRTDWPPPSPAIWEVTGADGQKGWLFGTVHSLPDGFEWRTPAIDAAFDEAGVLVVEIAALGDGDAANDAFMLRARRPGLPPVSERVAPADRPALRDFMERAGMTDAALAGMESWAAGLLLANGARRNDPGNGVDRALLAQGKPVVGLESFADQYDRFDRLPEKDQADLLVGLAHDADSAQDDTHLVAWLTGDEDALEKQASIGILAYPNLRKALLTDRNRAWLGRIEKLVEGGRKPFVAVGAAHMLGSGGLPKLLAADGYTVRRIR